MKTDLTAALRRARDAVRAGDPAAATRMIQAGLAGEAMPPAQSPKKNPMGRRRPVSGAGAAGRRSAVAGGLRETHESAAGSRDYILHLPKGRETEPVGVVTMLHGCTQTPEDFAAGTAMNDIADRHGLAVIWPAQCRGANMQSCWNWFSPGDQARGGGEPEILADLARSVTGRFGLGADRSFVAGLSAGGAMASILGQTHADVFSAAGVHSGLARGSARDLQGAFAAMRGDVTALAPSAPPVRSIVFHGTADVTVAPVNGDHVARAALGECTVMEQTDTGTTQGCDWHRTIATDSAGRSVVEHWRIDGLGHAWSGGRQEGSYTDTAGPDASAEMVRFFLSPKGDSR